MKNRKTWVLAWMLSLLMGTGLLANPADYYPANSNQNPPPQPSKSSEPIPFLVSKPTLRPQGTGWDVGVYGGITPFQDGDLDITSPYEPGASIKARTQDKLGETVGLRLGYTWPSFAALAGKQVDPDEPPDWVMPAVEYDFSWTGLNYKARDASFGTGATLTSDITLATLSIDPMIKFRAGPLHPYIGLGIGGTYVNAGNGKVNFPGYPQASLSGSSDDVDFSIAPMFGAELFFSQQWALTAEYKYLYIVDPKLSGGGTINYHSDGLGAQLVTAGLKFFF